MRLGYMTFETLPGAVCGLPGGSLRRVAFVSGPYRGRTVEERDENIRRARLVGRCLRRLGYLVIIPHCNSGGEDGTVPDAQFLEEGLALMAAANFVVVLAGWETSEGKRRELDHAADLFRGVFYWGHCMALWADEVKGEVVK